jgi:hypothetical protein
MMRVWQRALSVLCVLLSACVSDVENATGIYEGDANVVVTLGGNTNSRIYRAKVAVVPQDGEDTIVVVGWDGLCRAEAVVEGGELEISTSTCSQPSGADTLRFTYSGAGDISDSGQLDLELTGGAAYITEGGDVTEGTFSFTFSGKRQE